MWYSNDIFNYMFEVKFVMLWKWGLRVCALSLSLLAILPRQRRGLKDSFVLVVVLATF